MTERIRTLMAGTAAAVSVVVAITLVVTTPQDAPSHESFRTPVGVEWSVDAESVLGAEFATFADPVGGRFGEVRGGVVDAGDVLVTEVGLVNQKTSGFDRALYAGLDSATGAVLWTTSTNGAVGCADAVVDATLWCHSVNDVIAIDTDTGQTRRQSTEWAIASVEWNGGSLYVVEVDDDGYSARVHKGTVDDPTASWTVDLPDAAVDSTVARDLVDVVDGIVLVSLDTGTTSIDASSGRVVQDVTFPDCTRGQTRQGDEIYILVGRACSDMVRFRTDLIDTRGRTVAGVDAEIYQRVTVNAPTSENAPILLGGNAFDPTTAQLMWTGDDFANGSDLAVIGDVVLGIGPSGRDLFSGRRIWSPTVEALQAVPTAARDGLGYVVEGFDVVAVDPETGQRVRAVPIDGLLGNTEGYSRNVALLNVRDGVMVVNERRLGALADDIP